MKLSLLILAVILFHSNSICQDWLNQQNFQLNEIYFYNENYGWAVGANGTVLRTTDSGDNWISESSGTTQELDDVFFLSESIGWLCGAKGQIRKSTDGGITWSQLPAYYQSHPYHTIQFTSEMDGWVGGYFGLDKTTDGGNSWSQITTDGRIWGLYFISENYGWVAKEGGLVIYTTDGGTSWNNSSGCPSGVIVTDIHFSDYSNGWIVGYDGLLYKSTDGGASWNSVSTGYSSYHFRGVHFINTTTGWIVGTNGLVIKTSDSGINWTQQSTNISDHLMDISINGTNGWVCGFNGRILKNSATNPLPIELSSLSASVQNNVVTISWRTETEVNSYGFEIERSANGKKWIKLGFVNGAGNSNSAKEYSYKDKNPVGGNLFQYRLKQIDNDGEFEYSNVIEVKIIPDKFYLYQNYPNPFNPSTTIKWELPLPSNVTIKLFNSLGEELEAIFDEYLQAGIYSKSIILNSEFPSGVYFYQLRAGEFIQTHKMILLK